MRYIFAGGMQRSGSTLQYNIAAELVERFKVGSRAAWTEDHASYFSGRPRDAQLVVFKSHVLSPPIAELISEGDAVALTCHRDIRDVAASWQVKLGRRQRLKEVVRRTSKAIEDFTSWESLPPARVLVSRYETMVEAVPDEVSRIAEMLGLAIGPPDVDAISRALDSRQLKQRLESLSPDDTERAGPYVFDRKTLLHLDHLNGGEVGRYRSELKHSVVKKLTEIHRDWLESHGYTTSRNGGRPPAWAAWHRRWARPTPPR